MNPGLKRAKSAPLVIPKARTASRIAWGAFLGSTKIKKARLRVKIALKTRPQPIQNVSHHVTFVVQEGQHEMEAWFVLNVWPGNLKIRLTRTERFVPSVHGASTRTRQACQRASSAQLVMRNLLRNKRRALNAAPVNSTMLQVLLVANCASIRRTLVAKEETAVASIVQLDGRPKTAVRNAWRAARVRLALGV